MLYSCNMTEAGYHQKEERQRVCDNGDSRESHNALVLKSHLNTEGLSLDIPTPSPLFSRMSLQS